MTRTPPTPARLDAALEQLQRHRERIVRLAPGPARSTCIAHLYQREAALWSALFECTHTRVYWRAALAARERACQLAGHWRLRASVEMDRLTDLDDAISEFRRVRDDERIAAGSPQ